MAIDGTDILESDLSIDVQNEILDRYDSGNRQMKLDRI